MTARSRAEAAWGVTPAVVADGTRTRPPLSDAGIRPAHDVVSDPTNAWAQFEAQSAEELRAALRLDERLGWAEEISGGVVRYPAGVDRPWVRAVQDRDEEG